MYTYPRMIRKCQLMTPPFQAVKQIADTFRPYKSIQRIAQIWRRIQELQGELRSKIDADWDRLYVPPHLHLIPSCPPDASKLRTGSLQTHQAVYHGLRLSGG